jgi:hypothetical protein
MSSTVIARTVIMMSLVPLVAGIVVRTIALAVARANFPEEPNRGATILPYLLIGLIVGVPYIARVRKLTTSAVPAA